MAWTNPAEKKPYWEVGDVAFDREDGEYRPLLVVKTHQRRADEWRVEGGGGDTVAEENPGYPDDDPIIRCVRATEAEIGEFQKQAKENIPAEQGTSFGQLVAREARRTEKDVAAYPQSRLVATARV